MTEYQTYVSVLRVRIKALPPPEEFEEFDLHRYEPGEEYDIPSRLASLLIIGGYAELTSSVQPRVAAADSSRSRKR